MRRGAAWIFEAVRHTGSWSSTKSRPMPTTCTCPTCGSRLTLPEEHVGRRVSCPKCSAQFEATAPPDLSVSPASEAIAPAPLRDPLPQAATAGEAHYLTEHPKPTQRRAFADDEGGEHPPAQFLDGDCPAE